MNIRVAKSMLANCVFRQIPIMSIFNGTLSLPAAADMHVHVRDGTMLDLVAPTIRQGGVDTVFVMFVPS